MVKRFDRELLLDCANMLLEWMSWQDPAYAQRIQITRDEHKRDDLQVISAYIARTLDLGEHMYYVEREFCNPGYSGHCGPRECEICGGEFSTSVSAATVCSKQFCLDEKAKRLDAEFEAKVK